MSEQPQRAMVARPERVMVQRTDDTGRTYTVPRAEWMAWAAHHARDEYREILRALRAGERQPPASHYETQRDRAVRAEERAAHERWRRGEPETRAAWERRWMSQWEAARACGDEAHCDRIVGVLGHVPRMSGVQATHEREVIE